MPSRHDVKLTEKNSDNNFKTIFYSGLNIQQHNFLTNMTNYVKGFFHFAFDIYIKSHHKPALCESKVVKVVVITCSALIFTHIWMPPISKKAQTHLSPKKEFGFSCCSVSTCLFLQFLSLLPSSFSWVYYITELCGSLPNETWYYYCMLKNVFHSVSGRVVSPFFDCP